jgi:hypothetical protein
VHAFDPSPIAKRFYQQSESLHRLINYKFHDYGAGGRDGAHRRSRPEAPRAR